MPIDDSDKIARAYARLQALKENLPEGSYVRERYVTEYHEILDQHLAQVFDLVEFRIPDKWIVPLDEAETPPRGTYAVLVGYTELWVERQSFLVRLDGILGYFRLFITASQDSTQDTTRQRIGFQGPRRDDGP